jgi:hypothetical protein
VVLWSWLHGVLTAVQNITQWAVCSLRHHHGRCGHQNAQNKGFIVRHEIIIGTGIRESRNENYFKIFFA